MGYQMRHYSGLEWSMTTMRKIVQFLAKGTIPEGLTTNRKNHLVVQDADFQLIVRELYNMGPGKILRQCVLLDE